MTTSTETTTLGRIGLLWRGDPSADPPTTLASSRMSGIATALAAAQIVAEPVIYAEEVHDRVREQLLRLDGVLVWVDPMSSGRNRAALDVLLREVAARGVWVSAHPDVILQMGVKEMLHRTRNLGWSTDTALYRSLAELRAQLPARLAGGASRVLKPNRGNGGIGVWRVELVNPDTAADGNPPIPGPDALVRAQHAVRGSVEETLTLGAFLDRCATYFDGTYAGPELVLDQAFQSRLADGMIRCYLVQNRVVGYGHQLVKALVPHPPGADAAAAVPGPRIMHGPDAPEFQSLRDQLERTWLPAMLAALDLTTADLPVIWDADFLYGPRTEAGADTYVLCEVNISSVYPFPDTALAPMAACVARRLSTARRR